MSVETSREINSRETFPDGAFSVDTVDRERARLVGSPELELDFFVSYPELREAPSWAGLSGLTATFQAGLSEQGVELVAADGTLVLEAAEQSELESRWNVAPAGFTCVRSDLGRIDVASLSVESDDGEVGVAVGSWTSVVLDGLEYLATASVSGAGHAPPGCVDCGYEAGDAVIILR